MARAKREGRKVAGIRSRVRGRVCGTIWTLALLLEQAGSTGEFDLAFSKNFLGAVLTIGWTGLREEA